MALRERKSRLRKTDASPSDAPATSTTPEPEAGGLLTINLATLTANWIALGKRVLPAECAAVVKADAYGCGLAPVAGALAEAGCKTFFVAHLSEARQVRALASDATIYVLNGIPPGSAAVFAEVAARPVIGSLSEVAEWDGFRATSGWQGEAALHFDTGLNRLGLAPEEAQALSPRSRNPDHGIALVMSHLACADTPNHPLNLQQIQLFRELRMMYRGIPASLANSSGIFLGPSAHCDVVRAGIAMYGGNPTPGLANPMSPVIDVRGRVLQVRQVARGQTVGYGATWTAAKPSVIAVVSVGYADGYLRAASPPTGKGGAQVMVAGQRCPVVGRISMDLMAVDVTALPAPGPRRGDYVTLIGGGIGVDDLAGWGGTIGYEVLTSLGQRYSRRWTRDDDAADGSE